MGEWRGERSEGREPAHGGEKMTASVRRVATGAEDPEWIAIVSGLSEGERVMTMSASPVKDGGQGQEARGERRPGGLVEGETPGVMTGRMGPMGGMAPASRRQPR